MGTRPSTAPVYPSADGVQDLEVRNLVPASWESPDRKKDAGLAASVKEHGVQQPILVRPHPKRRGKFEVVFGHRRLRAATAAKFPTIPGRVEVLEDGQARALALIENLDREDPDPIDEARQIAELVDGGMSVAKAAQVLGRSSGWVARRSNLQRLSPAWRKVLAGDVPKGSFLQPEWFTVGHLELIALFDNHEEQDALMDDLVDQPTIEYLKRIVAQRLQRLGSAPWKLEDEQLVPEAGACSECTKHSGAQPDLFEGLVQGGGQADAHCRDGDCWARKLRAHTERKLAQAREKHGAKLPTVRGNSMAGGLLRESAAEVPKGTLSHWEWTPAKASDKGATRVMVVSGKGAGTVRWAKLTGSGRARTAAKKATKKAPKPGSAAARKEGLAKLKGRRQALLVDKVREGLRGLVRTQLTDKAGHTDYRAEDAMHCALLRWLVLYDSRPWHGDAKGRLQDLLGTKLTWEQVLDLAWEFVQERVLQAFTRANVANNQLGQLPEEALWWAEHALGWDPVELRDLVEKEIPAPRSLEAAPAKKKATKARKKTATKKRKKVAGGRGKKAGRSAR